MNQNVADLILVAIILVDIVQQRREILALRKLVRESAKTKSNYQLKIECDNVDALAKIEQVRLAAHQAAAELQNLEQLRRH